MSINTAGNQPDFTMYVVNGLQILGSGAGNTSLNLSVGAIDQFEVHYGFFMPDMGPNPGIVDVVTKSGTNIFMASCMSLSAPIRWSRETTSASIQRPGSPSLPVHTI